MTFTKFDEWLPLTVDHERQIGRAFVEKDLPNFTIDIENFDDVHREYDPDGEWFFSGRKFAFTDEGINLGFYSSKDDLHWPWPEEDSHVGN